MSAILFIIIIIQVGMAAGSLLYIQSRRNAREQKGYERGLKMISLLIHLPPPSDDTEVNGRAVPDVIDENVSKAQIIYNIIASTFQKGWKSRIYGQRHFTFEIIGSQGF